MAKLTDSTNLNGTITVSKATGTKVTLDTDKKYLDKDIELNINVSAGSVVASVSSNTSGSASMAATGFTASSSATSYYVTLSTTAGSVKAKATGGTPGYVTSSTTNETAATSVSVSGNGNKLYIPAAAIAGSSTNATATTTVAPGNVTIAKQSTPSGVTNAASGNATETAPSSGVYVAVKATTAANSTGTTSSISGSGSATVSTAGYAPTTLTGSVSVSGTATAKTSEKASNITYIPITTATPTFKGGAISGTATASSSTGASLSTSTNDSGITIVAAGSANRAVVQYNSAVSGWVSKAASAEAYTGTTSATSLTSTTYYLNGIILPKDKKFTVTTTEDTALDTTSDLDIINNAYRRVDITNNANGTVLVTGAGTTQFTSASATTGNLKASAFTNASIPEIIAAQNIVINGKWAQTDVSAAGTYYGRVIVAAGGASTNFTNTGISTYFNSGTSSSNSISITPRYSTTAGYVGNATNTNGTTSYYTIKTASPTFSAAPTGGSTAEAVSSTCSISNSTNNSGVSFQTKYSINAVAINYAAAATGWISKAANAATGSNTTAKSSTNGTLYYINGVTMATPSSGTHTFSVTAPSGGINHTYLFTQDANGRTSIKVDNTVTMQWNDTTKSMDFIYT